MSWKAFALPVTMGLSALYSATSVYSLPLERPLFGLIMATALWVGCGKAEPTVPSWARSLCLLWLAVAAFYLLVSVLQPHWLATYAAGDFALSLLPLLAMLAFLKERRALTQRAVLYLLVALLASAALGALLFADEASRFPPPSAFLIGASWYFLLEARAARARVVGLGLTAGVGYLAYASGYRTHLLLWLIAPIVVLSLVGGWHRVLRWATTLAVGLGLLAVAGHPIDLTSSLAESRFQTLLSGQQDVSLSTRFLELRDVLSTAQAEWAPGQQLLGSGFGASYVPNESNITRNILSDGRVHNIHIGPALVFFRYGLLGLFIMGCLLVFVARIGARIRSASYTCASRDLQIVLWCALVLFLIESLTLNATVDPLMSYSLGGLLAVWAIGQRSRRAMPARHYLEAMSQTAATTRVTSSSDIAL